MENRSDIDPLAWRITQRWQEYEGEARSALLRVLLVAAFYLLQLVHFFLFADRSAADVLFHRHITLLAAAWLFVSLGVLVALKRSWFPPGLKFVTSGCDLILLTISAALGSGPASALVSVYYLLIAMSCLRSSLRLIWFTTIGAMLGYLTLVGIRDTTWFDAEHQTRPIDQFATLLTLAATGVVLGQMLRMTRQILTQYNERRATVSEPVRLKQGTEP